MTLYDDMIAFKHELLAIREELGDPRVRSLAFEFAIDNQTNYLIITPKPTVTSPPKKILGLALDPRGNFTVAGDDYYVEDISRAIPKEAFTKKAWLDFTIGSNGKLAGIACRCHYVDDQSSALSYNLILRKEIEQRR